MDENLLMTTMDRIALRARFLVLPAGQWRVRVGTIRHILNPLRRCSHHVTHYHELAEDAKDEQFRTAFRIGYDWPRDEKSPHVDWQDMRHGPLNANRLADVVRRCLDQLLLPWAHWYKPELAVNYGPDKDFFLKLEIAGVSTSRHRDMQATADAYRGLWAVLFLLQCEIYTVLEVAGDERFKQPELWRPDQGPASS